MDINVEYIESESGWVVIDGYKTGWYITANGIPVAGPYDIDEIAEKNMAAPQEDAS